MKLNHLLEYVAFAAVSSLIRLLPLAWVRALAKGIGGLAFALATMRRRVATENLRYAFPEKTEEERRIIARESFKSIATAFLELVWTENLSRDDVRREISITNPEVVQELVRRKRSMVLLTGHFGNWEWFAQSVNVICGAPLNVIAKGQTNELVDKRINQIRECLGNKVIPMSSSVKETLRVLSEGGVVGIVGDQAAAKESVWVVFFGRSVPTHQGPAVFSLKTKSPLIIGFSIRQPNGTYVAEFREVSMNGLNDYTPANVEELTRRHVRITEEIIRQFPGQWMWTHRRWKHVESVNEASRTSS